MSMNNVPLHPMPSIGHKTWFESSLPQPHENQESYSRGAIHQPKMGVQSINQVMGHNSVEIHNSVLRRLSQLPVRTKKQQPSFCSWPCVVIPIKQQILAVGEPRQVQNMILRVELTEPTYRLFQETLCVLQDPQVARVQEVPRAVHLRGWQLGPVVGTGFNTW